MYDFFVSLLNPLMWGEAWVMTAWHQLFVWLGIPYENGWGWALSIVGLTVVVRFLMIPLFVKQIHSSRRMQLIQPEMQKIQAKYKGKSDPESRQKMTQETMDLYKRTGSNPFSSCLPILLQSPFFFALFQVLNNLPHVASGAHPPIGPITPEVASVIEKSTIFGAQLSSTFLGSSDLNVKILTAVLIVLMSVSTFTTQRQLMRKNMPDAALDNPYMKQQKVILYLMPIFFAISGINFPIGVLLYWLTTNVWSMGQQFYVIRRMPAPGSAAERAYEERQRKRGKTIKKLHIPGLGDTTTDQPDVQDALPEAPKGGQRQQPKGKKRSKRSAGGGPTDGAGSSGADGTGSPGDEADRTGGPNSPDGSTPQDAPTEPSSPANGSEAPARPTGQRQQPKRQKQKPRPKQPQGQQVKRQTDPPGKRRPEGGTPSPDAA
ncbi:MAG TPA: membrane protein insertase YidC [Lapillicoccus sp.]|nr:membrane protein insertase YidC [Lapillicoccus sp.]